MRKLYVIFMIILMSSIYSYAFTWDDCIQKYEKAKRFTDHTMLSYTYLKLTKTCLVKFRNFLKHNPNPEFSVKAMNNNIVMLEKNLNKLLPKYHFANKIEQIPKYVQVNNTTLEHNKEYGYFKRFENCNGIHAQDKIYTAKHCNIKQSKNMQYDLNYIPAKTTSKLQTAKLSLDKKGTFKYYSMSKVGLFYNVLLKENNCQFYKAKNIPLGQNKSLDLTDLTKKEEIRSNCLAIPSNSGGGVFQEGKLVAIISKTVFKNNEFLYSVIEPIVPIKEDLILNAKNEL